MKKFTGKKSWRLWRPID